MEEYIGFVKELVQQGGPTCKNYDELVEKLRLIATITDNPEKQIKIVSKIRNELGDALSMETVQGHAFQKPYGYSGDFNIIDKIYQQHISSIEELKNWDIFFHSQKAPIAVRNRKQYFLNLLAKLRNRNDNKINILNIASGPCRDILEYLHITQDKNINFHCVDYDINAIKYAREICADHLEHITFYHKNALRFKSDIKFDLIWSGGLFDYFTDKQFIFMLKRFYNLINDNGEIIVGNFHPNNPSKDYMEIIGNWYLNYRTEFDLLKLARDAGFCLNNIRIGVEEQYINLFLHIKKSANFL